MFLKASEGMLGSFVKFPMPVRTAICCLCVVAGFGADPRAGAQVILTNAAQLRQLSTNAASARLQARVTGVVTYYDAPNHLAFVQDPSAGTYVSPTWRITEPDDFSGSVESGMLVEVSGRSQPGRFAPFLSGEPTARILGRAEAFPEPIRPLRGQLLEPTFHSQWIEVEAFVRTVGFDRGRLRLGLAYGPRRFEALVTGDWESREVPPELLKSDVRVRGVYGSIFNDERQLVNMRLLVPSIEQITVIDPGMSLAFAQEPKAIDEIMQFNPNRSERIHLRGVVLAHLVGEGLYLRGDHGAVWVGTEYDQPLAPGQLVSVVGFPRPGEVRPLLLDAIVKVLDEFKEPEPRVLAAEQVVEEPVDADLVTMEARLVDLLERPGNSMMLLQGERTSFSARLLEDAPLSKSLKNGSWMKLTGICVMQGEQLTGADPESGNLVSTQPKPTGFSLIVRDQSDLEVLQGPPWWTLGRVRNLLLVMAAVTGGIFLWGAMLRHKVREQTVFIAEQIEHERIAEERARIARELHDTLEQELVGIKMALDTAASRLDAAPEKARRSIDQARAMIRQSQAEARQSVWDLRAANLAQEDLDKALAELLTPLSQPDGTVVSVTTNLNGRPPFDGVMKNHVLRIAQESVTNALKHAAADQVTVRLETGPDELELCVEDNGSGFDLAGESGKNGHFGLIGMRERANKLNGRLLLKSEPGKGSTVRLLVPFKNHD